MKVDIDNIPSEIFDWIETSNFISLTMSQQELVIQWLTPEEYDEMHLGTLSIREMIEPEHSLRQDIIREDLLLAFDRHHSKSKRTIPFIPLQFPVWQVASMVLLAACSLLIYSLVNQKTVMIPHTVSSTDTVYIIREVPVAAEYDDTPSILRGTNDPVRVTKASVRQTDPPAPASGDIHIFKWKERNEVRNRQKRNSVQDDSLVQNMSFTTL